MLIVGAGTIGLSMAAALSREKLRVLIVEAGASVAAAPSDEMAPNCVGKHHSGLMSGRAIGLGGTSTLWGGQLAEFVEEDLQKSGHEWPITYRELEIAYDEVNSHLGMPDRRSDREYTRSFGVEGVNSDDVEIFYTRWMKQPNMATLFRDVVQGKHVDIVTGANAFAFKFLGRSAVDVSLFAGDEPHCVSAKQFVLAAGTIGNTQLMLSARRHGDVPWSQSKTIGKFFHDHLGVTAGRVKVIDDDLFRRMFENGIAFDAKLQPKIRPKSIASDTPAVCGFFAFRSDLSEHLSNMKQLVRNFRAGIRYSDVKSFPANAIALSRVFAPAIYRFIRQRRIMAFYDKGVEFLIQSEQWPVADSAILDASLEPAKNGLIPIALDWRIDGRELGSIREFVLQVKNFLESSGVGRLELADWVTSEEPFTHILTDTYHQSGGLRMGTGPSDSVTDSNLCVWNTDNVYIAGASTLPSSSYANCTYTALALGHRLARQISEKSKGIK